MIQTRFKNLYLCEIKFSHHPISKTVIPEITKDLKDTDFFAHTLDSSEFPT
ncbi:MAG: hypothetical protein V4489_03860 [Chlamydiota bacterium]